MKLLRLLVVLVSCSIGRSETTNSFGIYLTEEPVDRRITASGKGDWSHIRLSGSPVISATDIVSYNFTDHSMQLKPEALAKIPRPAVEGTPFVVVANGERVYLGAFTTIESSMGPLSVPCIEVDRRIFVTNQPADTLVIDRGVGPDLRGDLRIRKALKPLGEHTSPTMTIPEALQIAERYVADQKLDISKHFISSVRYHESGALTQTYISKGPCWQVTYELMQYANGGQYFILVYMDRKVGHISGL